MGKNLVALALIAQIKISAEDKFWDIFYVFVENMDTWYIK